MEELLELKELLISGNIPDALPLMEEMTEMSKDDKLNKISSFARILLLHLIKIQAEERTTKSWEASIDNSVYEIQKTNRRRKAGGNYLSNEELREAVADAYQVAMSGAAVEAFGGCYRTHLASQEAAATRLSISLIKHRVRRAFAFSRVLSKFLTRLLHLSPQALLLSTIQRIGITTKPDFPWAFFSAFDCFGATLNRIFVMIWG